LLDSSYRAELHPTQDAEVYMRLLTVIGIVVLVLGILSFVVPVPVSHTHSAKIGDASVGITTHDHEKLSPAVGGVLCAAGVILLIAGTRRATA
jgi:hypothetical protein